jgi:hypothetical protein
LKNRNGSSKDATPSKSANPAAVWPANWKEINKSIDEVNRLTREAEEK